MQSPSSSAKQQDNEILPEVIKISKEESLLEEEICLDYLFCPSAVLEQELPLDGEAVILSKLPFQSCGLEESSDDEIISSTNHISEHLSNKEHEPQIQKAASCNKEDILGKDAVKLPLEEQKSSFWPVTMELTVNSIHHLLETAERDSKSAFKSWQPFGVVGLHTCGDLASTALRVFAQEPRARVMCMVGCCYHHITETKEDGTCST